MMKNKWNLSQCEREIKKIILERQEEFNRMGWGDYNVAGVVVYGSRAREEHREDSDLDIAVLTRDGKSTDSGDFETKISASLKLSIDINEPPVKYDSFNPRHTLWYSAWEEHEHPYNIVSPFKEIKKCVEGIIKNSEQKISKI